MFLLSLQVSITIELLPDDLNPEPAGQTPYWILALNPNAERIHSQTSCLVSLNPAHLITSVLSVWRNIPTVTSIIDLLSSFDYDHLVLYTLSQWSLDGSTTQWSVQLCTVVYGNHSDGVAFVIWDNHYGINSRSKHDDSIKLLIKQENNDYVIQNDIVKCIVFYSKNGSLDFKHFLT